MNAGQSGQPGPAEVREDPAGDRTDPEAAPAAGGLLASLLRFVEELLASVGELIEIGHDRLHLSIRRAIIEVIVGAGVAVGVVVWVGASVLATLRGLCAGLAALFGGQIWLGELLGGLLGLALLAGAVVVTARRSSRRELSRLEAKYDRLRGEPTQDGRGAARAPGGRGASADAERDAALR